MARGSRAARALLCRGGGDLAAPGDLQVLRNPNVRAGREHGEVGSPLDDRRPLSIRCVWQTVELARGQRARERAQVGVLEEVGVQVDVVCVAKLGGARRDRRDSFRVDREASLEAIEAALRLERREAMLPVGGEDRVGSAEQAVNREPERLDLPEIVGQRLRARRFATAAACEHESAHHRKRGARDV